MRKMECAAVRQALSAGMPVSGQEPHLFRCPACRVRVQISLAWKGLPRWEPLELAAPADEAFVARVVAAVASDRRRQMRARVRLAAAAALLFFFFAGAGERVASRIAAGAEEAYSQLVESSALEGLLTE